MPQPVQAPVLASARSWLNDTAWAKLCRAVGQPSVPGLVAAGLAVNHSGGLPAVFPLGAGVLAAAGLFVLAGATPAAVRSGSSMSCRVRTPSGVVSLPVSRTSWTRKIAAPRS